MIELQYNAYNYTATGVSSINSAFQDMYDSLGITFTINFVLEVLLNILGYAFAIRDSIQQANRRTILVQCIL
jgi:hypothetical protein